MTKAEIFAELKKEFDPELGFFVRMDGELIWNTRALMLWGLFFEKEKEEKMGEA